MTTHWSTLVLIYEDAGTVKDEQDKLRFLRQLKREGRVPGAFVTST